MTAQDRSSQISWLQHRNDRINLRRLFRWLLLTLIVPMSFAMGLDFLLNLQPFITILAIVIVIPLATFFIVRIVMDEFDKVLLAIVPEEVIPAPIIEVNPGSN